MLLPPNPDAPLQQGDIIQDVPFLVLPKAFNIKAQGQPGQVRLECQKAESIDKVKEHGGGKSLTAVEVPLALQFGMIVTQGCDLDHKDQITLARVFPINALIQQAKDAIEHCEPLVLHDVIQALTERSEPGHLVYLGLPCGSVPQVGDLLRLQSFPQDWKVYFRKHRLSSLTPEALRYLQSRLSAFGGRYATDEGFWYGEKDREHAETLRKNRPLLKEAQDRLQGKKDAKTK